MPNKTAHLMVTTYCEVRNQIVKAGKGEGGQQSRGKDGKSWKDENREVNIEKERLTGSQRRELRHSVVKVFLLLSRVVFYLTICS